ncbi:MAG: lipid-A-disaccharide synthase [Cytophagales bacterium]
MKYYIVAGERSGDLHASNVMRELKKLDSGADFRFFGGDYMKAQGGKMVLHYKAMAYMGFLEVALNLDKVFANINLCKKDILTYQPDSIILVDYSGFNLRIAKFLKKNAPSIKIYYYISPKIWAWNTGRANKIKHLVDKMLCILPFEKAFYKKFDFEVEYVGNPSLDEVNEFKADPNFRKNNSLQEKPIIAILPGSRKSEVDHMLHFMVSILPAFREYQFVVAAVSNLDSKYYKNFERQGIVSIVYDQTYDLLANSEAAVVTSGTATLETALFEVPQVVCYATSFISYAIIRALIKIKHISLVNLIAEKEVVRELIQDEFSPTNLMEELLKITQNETVKTQMIEDYKAIKAKLGNKKACENTALSIYQDLNK